MILQILPPDFQYTTETVTINNAEVVTLTLVALVFGVLLVYNLVKSKKAKSFARMALLVNFIVAVIKKDLKIS